MVKTLREGFVQKDKEEFQKELQIFSELQHQNVACLKVSLSDAEIRVVLNFGGPRG